jgi:hypothetical protein
MEAPVGLEDRSGTQRSSCWNRTSLRIVQLLSANVFLSRKWPKTTAGWREQTRRITINAFMIFCFVLVCVFGLRFSEPSKGNMLSQQSLVVSVIALLFVVAQGDKILLDYCVQSPQSSNCTNYVLPDPIQYVQVLCDMMPEMVGCTISKLVFDSYYFNKVSAYALRTSSPHLLSVIRSVSTRNYASICP